MSELKKTKLKNFTNINYCDIISQLNFFKEVRFKVALLNSLKVVERE